MATATMMGEPVGGSGKSGIVDDFMYGTNVASAHIYIRMGKFVFGVLKYKIFGSSFAAANTYSSFCIVKMLNVLNKKDIGEQQKHFVNTLFHSL